MLETLRVWKSAKQSRMVQLETKMQCIKTALITWIRKRRADQFAIAKATKEVEVNTSMAFNAEDSIRIQGLQESNLDYTMWSIQKTSKISDKGVQNQPADDVDRIKSKTVEHQHRFNERFVTLCKYFMYAWRFVHRKAQIKLYKEISLCYFIIRAWQKMLHRIYNLFWQTYEE
jgi:hypothetical protein